MNGEECREREGEKSEELTKWRIEGKLTVLQRDRGEKRRSPKVRQGRPRGMEEAEAAPGDPRLPAREGGNQWFTGVPTRANLLFHLEPNWKTGTRRLGGTTKLVTKSSPELGRSWNLWVSKDHRRRAAQRKVLLRRLRWAQDQGLWTEAGHQRILSAPAGEGSALQPESSFGVWGRPEIPPLLGLCAEVVRWHSMRNLGCPADLQYRRLIHPGGCIVPNPRPSEKGQTQKLSEAFPRKAVVLKSKAEVPPHPAPTYLKEPQTPNPDRTCGKGQILNLPRCGY